MSKTRDFLTVIIVTLIIAIIIAISTYGAACWGHHNELNQLRSYKYIRIDNRYFYTENVEDFDWFDTPGRTFHMKDSSIIYSTNYGYYNELSEEELKCLS